MMTNRFTIFAAIYLCLWLVTGPPLLADLQVDWCDKEFVDCNYCYDISVVMFWVVLLLMWIATSFKRQLSMLKDIWLGQYRRIKYAP